jgi:hypothetical protein
MLKLEIGVMVSVAIWFVRMARLKRKSVLYWAFVGALSFFAPLFLFVHVIAPEIFESTMLDAGLLLFGVPLFGFALGLASCFLAYRRLLQAQGKTIEHVVSTLKDKNPDVRRRAAQVLYHTNDPGRIEPLIAALQDDDHEVRVLAANALHSLKDPRTVEPLIQALKDVNGDVRRIVSDTLGLLRDVRGVKPLIPILDDPDPNIHDAAKRALKRITGQDFGGDRTKWNEWIGKNEEK